MPYDEATAERVRRAFADRSDVVEKGMIGGGLGFLVGGQLCCGVRSEGLTVRVGPDARADALEDPHVRPLTIGTREPKAFVVIEPEGLADEQALRAWVDRGLQFVATLE